MNIDKITCFKIQNSIPTAYDDSLTFYEVVSKLIYKINSFINIIVSFCSKLNEVIADRNTIIKTRINSIIANDKLNAGIFNQKAESDNALYLDTINKLITLISALQQNNVTLNTDLNTINANTGLLSQDLNNLLAELKSVTNDTTISLDASVDDVVTINLTALNTSDISTLSAVENVDQISNVEPAETPTYSQTVSTDIISNDITLMETLESED